MSDFDRIVQRAVSDEEFAKRLVADPEQALRAEGVEPSPEMIEALRDVDVASVQRLAAAFGENRAAV